ncbi:multidrug resistance-associated protein [Asbolus verrucosus]|uniref:Multidrug resistance-associated protein n=1 Tax=Asbolus verrucosus TaxID=1661398 RepID=A0A482V6W4_ASBVE|nr:multidrug resistance-associated protein [Asbolus verrucosus]
MDITKEHYNPNPREKANPLSVIFFTYTIGMFKKGYSKTLDVDDLYSPIKSDRSTVLGDRLESKWNSHLESLKKSKKDKSPSLLKVLVRTFWPEFLCLGVILVVMDLLVRLSQPLMLGKLLDHFRPDSTVSKTEALWYAGAIVGLNALSALLINQYIMRAFHYGMKVRTACCALIYRKALRLSKTALADTASGKVVNLLSNDVSRFDVVSMLIHHMWVAPTSALIVTYLLYDAAGYAGIIGIAPVFLVVPLQSYTGKLSAIYRKKTALKTDERVRLMDEIISGVQVIKMYAWEIPFTKIIRLARKAELKVVMKSSYVRGLYMTFNLFTTRVFVFMSYYNILAHTMSSMFVRGISEVAEALVAIRRLQEFMTNEEFVEVKYSHNNNDNKINNEKTTVSLRDLTAKWNLSTSDNALTGITLSVDKRKLLGVIGPVGSGKSSLLQTILGELNVISGNIQINGTVSYASQDSWVFAATVRQNITFGLEFNRKRYNEVVHACALEKDFKQFPDGDLTIVGDRGASLSGGQKARINLARAVYREADIYLLDDPLSAVDIHVSKHLYDECVNGYLANKTRILVTHQVHHLKNADEIIILNNGVIENRGTFQNLSNSDNLYARLLSTEPEQSAEDRQKAFEAAKLVRQISTRSKTSSLASGISDLSIPESILQEENEEVEIKLKDLQEESSKGKVHGSLFFKYLLAGGNFIFVSVVLILYLVAQALASGVDFFVSFWVNIEEARNITNITNDDVIINTTPEWSAELCLYIYGGLIISLFVIALSRSMLFYKLAMLSSQKLHDTLFHCVINAFMRFFDTNPSGRILNRFSKDIGAIDELLPKAVLDAGQIILNMAGALVLVTIVNPYFLIIVAIAGVFFMMLRVVFLRSSKNIKRLEGMMRSPVFTHLNATLQGLTTIRAFQAQDILRNEFDKHQDYHTSAWFMYIAASSAFGFYLDLLCFIFVALVTFSFLTFGENMGLRGGEVGLAITQSAALTGLLQWGMRQSAEVANQLMSVERVLEYKELPKEKQPDKPKTPPKAWPDQGKITFKEMGLKYDVNAPLVLKDLDITINAKEKIGIVGRTGAGKSSLIAALFRLANVVGEIDIDGVDTKKLKLQDLRSKISIIPQDPVLFSGTLRYNLDPFEDYPDEVLYRALNEVELKDPANIINRLENRVMDRGSNYSVGQRQLICLARAIIRNNKILMLDEATANVDPQWMVKFCYKGTKKSLEVIDLYKTLTCDQSEQLTDNLEKHWNEEVVKAKLKIDAIPSLMRAIIKTFFWKYMGFGILLFFHVIVLRALQPVVLAYFINLFSDDQENTHNEMYISASILVLQSFLTVIFIHHIEFGQTAIGMRIRIAVSSLIYRKMLKLSNKSLGETAAGQVVNLLSNDVNRFDIVTIALHYFWITPFLVLLVTYLIWTQIIKLARKNEIDVVTKASYLRAIYLSCMIFIERTTLFLTITCYVLLGNPVTADKVFSMAQFFNILQFVMAICYPMAISFGAETLVSIKRLQEFLVLEEKPQSLIEKPKDKVIIFKNVSASWTRQNEIIKNFDLTIPQGTLCAIVGPVGAGKSSVLQMFLGELPPNTGSIKLGGSISYSAQEPWLFASTVRSNIIFGQEYKHLLYRQVVKICALEKDFRQFPQGDMTVVGERGVSLSGGQRARINLARAVYRQADVYLLDDPLSAVDTHVGKHLFEECILKYLKGKTRILVTHQLQYLKKADLIVVLNEGKIEAQGTFEELTYINLDFTKLLVAADETTEKEESIKTSFDRKSSIMSNSSTKSEPNELDTTDENVEEMGLNKKR